MYFFPQNPSSHACYHVWLVDWLVGLVDWLWSTNSRNMLGNILFLNLRPFTIYSVTRSLTGVWEVYL